MASPSMSTESESSAVEWASKLATNSPTNIAALTHSTICRTRRWRVANSVPISQQSFMPPSVPHAGRQVGRAHATHSHYSRWTPVIPQEATMASTVRGAVRELLEQTIATMDALLEASERELPLASSYACAQGKDLWTLLTNDIDHEKIHTGQVLEGRYESRLTASPMERLIAEWLAERARLIGSFVGLTDEQFNAETKAGEWTYRVIAKHVLALEQDSLKTLAADRAVRAGGQEAA